MTETIEQKQDRLAKLKAQQQALLERAKAVGKRIHRAESAANAKRRKQDNRTKTILGVAILGAAAKNPQARAVLLEAVKGLKTHDLAFLTKESELWAELVTPAPKAQTAASLNSDDSRNPQS